MPYGSVGALPEAVRKRYSGRCLQVFLEVFNQNAPRGDATAFPIAHTAAKNCLAHVSEARDAAHAGLVALAEKGGSDHFYGSWKGGSAKAGGGPDPRTTAEKTVGVDEAISILQKGGRPDIDRSDVGPFMAACAKRSDNLDLTEVHVNGTPNFGLDGLGIARADMPIIPNNRLPEYVANVKERGIRVTEGKIDPRRLSPIQKEVSATKAAQLVQSMEASGGVKKGLKGHRIVISSDNFVVDGHHRWAAATAYNYMTPKPVKIQYTRIGLPARDALKDVRKWNAGVGLSPKAMGEAFAVIDAHVDAYELREARRLAEAGKDDHFYGPWKGGSAKGGGGPADSPAGRAIEAEDKYASHDELIKDMEQKYPGSEWGEIKAVPLPLANCAAVQIDETFSRFGASPNFKGVRSPKHGPSGVIAEVKRVDPNVPGSAVYLYGNYWHSESSMNALYAQGKANPNFSVSNMSPSRNAYARSIVQHELGHQYMGLNLHARFGANRDEPSRKALEPWFHGKFLPNLKTAHVSQYGRRNPHEAWAELFAAGTGHGTSKSHFVPEVKGILDKFYPLKESGFAETDLHEDAPPMTTKEGMLCGWAIAHPEIGEMPAPEAPAKEAVMPGSVDTLVAERLDSPPVRAAPAGAPHDGVPNRPSPTKASPSAGAQVAAPPLASTPLTEPAKGVIPKYVFGRLAKGYTAKAKPSEIVAALAAIKARAEAKGLKPSLASLIATYKKNMAKQNKGAVTQRAVKAGKKPTEKAIAGTAAKTAKSYQATQAAAAKAAAKLIPPKAKGKAKAKKAKVVKGNLVQEGALIGSIRERLILLAEAAGSDHFYGAWKGGSKGAGGGAAGTAAVEKPPGKPGSDERADFVAKAMFKVPPNSHVTVSYMDRGTPQLVSGRLSIKDTTGIEVRHMATSGQYKGQFASFGIAHRDIGHVQVSRVGFVNTSQGYVRGNTVPKGSKPFTGRYTQGTPASAKAVKPGTGKPPTKPGFGPNNLRYKPQPGGGSNPNFPANKSTVKPPPVAGAYKKQPMTAAMASAHTGKAWKPRPGIQPTPEQRARFGLPKGYRAKQWKPRKGTPTIKSGFGQPKGTPKYVGPTPAGRKLSAAQVRQVMGLPKGKPGPLSKFVDWKPLPGTPGTKSDFGRGQYVFKARPTPSAAKVAGKPKGA